MALGEVPPAQVESGQGHHRPLGTGTVPELSQVRHHRPGSGRLPLGGIPPEAEAGYPLPPGGVSQVQAAQARAGIPGRQRPGYSDGLGQDGHPAQDRTPFPITKMRPPSISTSLVVSSPSSVFRPGVSINIRIMARSRMALKRREGARYSLGSTIASRAAQSRSETVGTTFSSTFGWGIRSMGLREMWPRCTNQPKNRLNRRYWVST